MHLGSLCQGPLGGRSRLDPGSGSLRSARPSPIRCRSCDRRQRRSGGRDGSRSKARRLRGGQSRGISDQWKRRIKEHHFSGTISATLSECLFLLLPFPPISPFGCMGRLFLGPGLLLICWGDRWARQGLQSIDDSFDEFLL